MDRIHIKAGFPDKETAGTKRYKITRNDEHGNPVQLTCFADRDEQVEAMMVRDKDGRFAYDTDPVYRMTVQDLTDASTFTEPTLARRSPLPTDADFLEGLRQDAIRERREQLVDMAGGKNAQAKYELALALTNGEFYDSAMEMQEATEQARPVEDLLKSMKQAGEGPLRWNEPTVDVEAQAKAEADHNAAILSEIGETIITVEGVN